MARILRFLIITLTLSLSALYVAHGQMERDVQFQFTAPGAESIELYGSFDGWARAHALVPSADGTWRITLKLQRGRYEYKFLVDNQWRHSPELPTIDDGFSGKNNMVVVR